MYKRTILKNRLEVVTSNMPHMESVAIGVWINAGGRYEDRKLCGISHFIEHMLFKGTLTRNATQLKQEIEGIGGHFNGFTSEEATCYLVKIPRQHLALGIDILSDMVLNPKMDEAEIEREKEVICEEIKMYKDQPSSFVHEILAGLMWPDNALGLPLAGHIDTVKSFTRRIIMDYKSKFYKPNTIAVVAAGNIIKVSKFLEDINKKFSLKPLNKKRPDFKKFTPMQKKLNLKLHLKDTEQTHIAIGFHTPGRNDKVKYVLDLLNIILGGNMSSRLFEELREKQALCYDVSSSVKKYEETGAFIIHAGVDNTKVYLAVEAIARELLNIKRFGVSFDELKRAKEYYKGQLLLALEDTGSRMLWLGDKIVVEESLPSVKKILYKIEKVTAEDIKHTAHDLFNNNAMNAAFIGPSKTLEENKIKRSINFK